MKHLLGLFKFCASLWRTQWWYVYWKQSIFCVKNAYE